jgi:hypothetical protein
MELSKKVYGTLITASVRRRLRECHHPARVLDRHHHSALIAGEVFPDFREVVNHPLFVMRP